MTARTAQMARMAAAAFQRYTFRAWQTQGGQAHWVETHGETLAEAVNRAALGCSHKATLFVLQTDELTDAPPVLSISAIKARKVWRKCPDTLVTKQVSETYPAEITQVRMMAFAPWSFDVMTDPVGRVDPGFVDAPSFARKHSEEAH